MLPCLMFPNAQQIWDDVTSDLSYLVGPGATRYQLQNIINNGHRGPLLSAEEILEPILDEQEARRND